MIKSFVGGNKIVVKSGAGPVPNGIGYVQEQIALSAGDRVAQSIIGGVHAACGQTAGAQDLLQLFLGLSSGAVAYHLQHARNAVGRDKNVGPRPLPSQLLEQTKAECRVGRNELSFGVCGSRLAWGPRK